MWKSNKNSSLCVLDVKVKFNAYGMKAKARDDEIVGKTFSFHFFIVVYKRTQQCRNEDSNWWIGSRKRKLFCCAMRRKLSSENGNCYHRNSSSNSNDFIKLNESQTEHEVWGKLLNSSLFYSSTSALQLS